MKCLQHVFFMLSKTLLFIFIPNLSETVSVLALAVVFLQLAESKHGGRCQHLIRKLTKHVLLSLKITVMVFHNVPLLLIFTYINLIVLCFTPVFLKHNFEELGLKQCLQSTLSSLF